MPPELQTQYNETDLEYDPFCLRLFADLEAAKRESLPKETMRIWFIEFVKRGWTKEMLLKRYNALMGTKIYGVEKLEIADWVNAVPVYAEDEVNLIIDRRINSMIQRGRFLKDNKDKFLKLTEADKQLIELAILKELEFEIKNEQLRLIDEYKATRKEELRREKKLNAGDDSNNQTECLSL